MSNELNITENTPPGTPEKRRKPASQRQLAANRANAQKSTGPRTPAGQAAAKFNALQHGLTARHVCLPGECREDYDERRRQYIELFKPANILELELVDELAAALWAKQRYTRIETLTMADQFFRTRVNVDANYHEVTPDGEAALAFRVLSDETNCLKLLERYATRATKDVRVAMQLLQDAIRMRPSAPSPAVPQPSETAPPPGPEPTNTRNEANPENEHPERPAFVPRTSEPISKAPHAAQATQKAPEKERGPGAPALFRTA